MRRAGWGAWAAVAAVAAAIPACGKACDDYAAPGLVVWVVRDGRVLCDAEVEVRLGDELLPIDVPDLDPPNCRYVVWERHGTFDVHVAGEGRTARPVRIEVGDDGCHPVTETVVVTL